MKILVIQTAFIGDVVLTTPLLVALRGRFPEAELHVIATPQGCEMLAGLAGVRCHALDKKKTSVVRGIRGTLDSLGRDTRFDLVLSVHRSLRSLALGKKVKARRRIAFRSFWARLFGYESVPYPAYDEAIHYADKALALLGPIGGGGPRPAPRLEVSARDESTLSLKIARVRGGLSAAQPTDYVVLSPFSVWGTKMWFADRFARVAIEIAKRHGLPIVVVGGGAGSESVIGQTIVEKVEAAGGQAVSLVGKTSLGELKAVIRDARLIVANDSAPVHVAAAFGVPTVAIFGPTVKKWGFFPLSPKSFVVERQEVSCRPCHIHGPPKCPKGHFRCMNEIQVEDVVAAVENLMRT